MILLDTDHLSVLLDERDSRREPLRQRIESAREPVACTIVSLEEILRGWLAAIHRRHNVELQIPAYTRLNRLFATMPFGLRLLSRYRPRVLTILLLIIIATLLVLANLSDEIHPRHPAWSPSPSLRFDVGEGDEKETSSLLNVSYGWPLLWRQDVVVFLPLGSKVLGQFHSPSRLVVNLLLWLTMLATAASTCEWLLRRYWPRLRWSLRTMIGAVGLAAALCGWVAAAIRRAEVQESLIATIAENHVGSVWVEQRGPKWLGVVGADGFLRRVVQLDIGYRSDELQEAGVYGRLGELPHLRYLVLDASCLTGETIDSLRQMRSMQTLIIDGKIPSGDSEKELAWHGCFEAIGQMPELVHLHLDGHRVAIASDSLASWSGLANLKTLCLYNFATHAPPLLKYLPPLPKLEAADFGYSRIGDQDLPYLAAIPNLKTLILTDTKVTGAGLAALARSESLEELSISEDAASAAGFESLLALKRLKKLHIDAYRGRRSAYVNLDQLALDHGTTILVPATELERRGSALDDLWESKPELIVDGDCQELQWQTEPKESQGYEEFPNTQRLVVHQLLREWKKKQSAK